MSDNADAAQVGRLALREEGEFWNAYYARPDTMDGAIRLGSVRMAVVLNQPLLKQAFIVFMRSVLDTVAREALGVDVVWPKPPAPAPEHERRR